MSKYLKMEKKNIHLENFKEAITSTVRSISEIEDCKVIFGDQAKSSNNSANLPEIKKLESIKDYFFLRAIADSEALRLKYSNVETFNNFKPNFFLSFYFRRKIKKDFLNLKGCYSVNMHPSLLPKYIGLNTHERVLENHEEVTGCTVHEVTRKLDCGRILGQATVPIFPDDNVEAIKSRVLEKEQQLYPKTLEQFCLGRSDLIIM